MYAIRFCFLCLSSVVLLLSALWACGSYCHQNDRQRQYRSGSLLLALHAGWHMTPDAQVVPHAPHKNESDNVQHVGVAMLNEQLQQAGAYRAMPIAAHVPTYIVSIAPTGTTSAVAHRLAQLPIVRYAEPNYVRQAAFVPNDTHLVQQWAIERVAAFAAWDVTTGMSHPIPIAVIDTGISPNHPDLQGKLLPGYNALTNNDQSDDDHGHGTAVAGLIAANSNNNEGIAGMCWGCLLMPVKVLDAHGIGDDGHLAQGIRWAVDHGARVINLSVGGADDSHTLHEAIGYAVQHDVLVIASSGNDQHMGNFANYPAAYPEVVAVGATTSNDTIAHFSTTGAHIDVVAPGVGLWTTMRDGGYGSPNGTSFASSFVAGAAGLVLSLRPTLSYSDVACILRASSDDVGLPGKDDTYGWGRLNVYRAVMLAQTDTACTLPDTPPYAIPTNQSQQPISPFAPVTMEQDSEASMQQANRQDVWYCPETHHTLSGDFLQFWRMHGGVAVFGYPLSEPFVSVDEANAPLVQYFERYRFEQTTQQSLPHHITLSRLGDELLTQQGRNWFTFPHGSPQADCLFFDTTKHSVCGAFLAFWRLHGLQLDTLPTTSYTESLALFGMPLSEPHEEEVSPGVVVLVQWFERARLEEHGELGVLLGRLGNEVAMMRGW